MFMVPLSAFWPIWTFKIKHFKILASKIQVLTWIYDFILLCLESQLIYSNLNVFIQMNVAKLESFNQELDYWKTTFDKLHHKVALGIGHNHSRCTTIGTKST
jgi:hypothetical protein